ncbi:cytochrome P450 [Microbispora sp. NPDC046933]|uniref:cytochrome P450 n=1 Tax=Microbispora sp. NPDC046933 TaxID=3155618 RepID=UPI0033D65F1F
MTRIEAPGPRGGRSLVRNVVMWRKDPAGFLLAAARDHGGVARLQLGPYLTHLVTDPAAVYRVVVENHRNYTRGRLYEQFKLVMGRGLLTSDGAYWRGHRRGVQPLFLSKAIGAIVPNVVEATNEMLDRWERSAADGEPVDLVAEMLRLTMVTLSRSLFGYDVDDAVPAVKRVVDAGLELMFMHGMISEKLPRWVPNARNRQIREIQGFLNEFVATIRDNHSRTGQGPLVELMEAAVDPETGRRWTDQEIRDELITVYMAGHETTATAAAWTLHAIATHSWIDEELTGEAQRVLAGRDPVHADADQLTFAGMVVQEALRMYPPIWIYPRDAIGDDELNGYHIPAGSSVVLSPLVSQRNPELFPNPQVFDPHRFAGDAVKRLPRLSYYPFGGGPRMCVGNLMALLELKLIISMIAQRFRLEPVSGAQVPYGHSIISLRPEGELRVRLRPRTRELAAAGGRS